MPGGWQTPVMAVFRHILMLTLRDDVTEDERQELASWFARMPAAMDFIRRYEFGFDLGNLGPDTPDFALVADFDSEEDWRAYVVHPEHEDLIVFVNTVAVGRTRAQYLVD